MRAKVIATLLVGWVTCSIYAFAADPTVIEPAVTQFKFASGNNSCNLTATAAKLPAPTVSLNAVALQRGSGESGMVHGYEVVLIESTIVHGIPSAPKKLKIADASILSDYFMSEGFVVKAQGQDGLYFVKGIGVGAFTGTMIRGHYFINVKLLDGPSLTYVIRDDVSLLDAAGKWTKCAIQLLAR